MRSVLTVLCLFGSTAHAVPGQFTHQGRLLDADGMPLEDETTITFRVTNADLGGDTLWEETITVPLTNGFYSAVLGAEDLHPLDTDVLSQAPVWLELQLEDEAPMLPRSAIHAVPYASMATVAEELSGGPVNASQIAVGDTPVVNESGEWVGPALTVNWDAIEGMPADFADGVDDYTEPTSDSFADLGTSCLDGDIPVWDGTLEEWSCTFDQDTLADMDCTAGQLVRWNDETVGWICSEDIDTVLGADEVNAIVADVGYAMMSEVFSRSFLDLVDVPDELLDGDDNTQLTAAEVDDIVADNGYAMATDIFSGSFSALTDVPEGLSDGDSDTLDTLSCEVGDIAVQTEAGWACSTILEQMDSDGDGIPTWIDCDDSDATTGSSADDADCDGTPTAGDCDDTDPLSTTTATDADCDGTITAEDCDDDDALSTIHASDADCDGTVTAEDCDDDDGSSLSVAEDADCDGITSEYDCNPDDPDASIDESSMVGSSSACPINTCSIAKNNFEAFFSGSSWAGGYYHLGVIGDSSELYCEPAADGGDPWTVVVKFSAMTDPCPSTWTATTMGAHNLCARNTSGVRSHTFPMPELDYSEMQGNIVGAFKQSVDGWSAPPLEDLTGIYVDGISVRMDTEHVYTLALGHVSSHCSRPPPSLVGDDYTCIVGLNTSSFEGPYETDWWEHSGGPGTTSDITVQLMADQGIDDEDVAIKSIQLKIR
jgi:hypothetical protein